MKLKALAAILAGATTAILAAPAGAADNFVTLGTGGITGGYYPVGGAVCSLVNQARNDQGLARTGLLEQLCTHAHGPLTNLLARAGGGGASTAVSALVLV